MDYFDKSNEGTFEHKFVKQDPQMLQDIFGTVDLTSFWIADMDFSIATEITQELERLVNRGVYAYEFGTREVYQAIIEWHKKRHQLTLERKSFIQVPSVLTGLALLLNELTEPNDAILIQTPVFHQFAQIIKNNHRKIVESPLQVTNGKYAMNFSDIEKKVQSENVKIIILCNPHNPVGRVWTKEELEKLASIADKYDVTIISDEIHADIAYAGHKFNSILSLNQKQHIALLGSPAKTFGMQSISNGYIYIPEEATNQKLKKVVEAMHLGDSNALTTFATIAAYKNGEQWVDDLLIYLQKTITWIEGYIQTELPLIKMYSVEGTYQIWLDFTEMPLPKGGLRDLLVKDAKLGLAPGVWFGKESSKFMRMNIASPLAKIKTGFEQLKLAYDKSCKSVK